MKFGDILTGERTCKCLNCDAVFPEDDLEIKCADDSGDLSEGNFNEFCPKCGSGDITDIVATEK